ncbi:MAG TPA: hypothetical protein VEY30_01285, partial [Myxococcaceae bacterium]|nr:hypothetical protein [Myxococcaceae bacterium]
LERVTGEEISHRVLSELLRRRLDLLGQFYLHTDLGALGKLAASMQGDPRLKPLSSASDEAGWRQLFDAPPAHAREAVLSHAVIPEHLGCGHLRLTLQHSEDYGVRPALAEGMLQAFHRVRWEGSVDVDLVTLPGGHHEGAVVNVRTAGELWPFTPVPLVSPSYGGTQMFVNHPQVSHYLRTLLAQFLVTQGDLLPTPKGCREALEREMAGLAETQLAQTLGHLARGLPVYDVTFERDDVRVEYRGKVG